MVCSNNSETDKAIKVVSERERDAAYHCGIDYLLRAAYRRDFSMMEMGRCKTKFPTFDLWYATLKEDQKQRVEKALLEHFHPALFRHAQ